MVSRKTTQQIATMRRAGRVVAEMHAAATAAAVPGATTASIDRVCREVLERRGARSNFLGYHGYPAVACVSPNEVVVHGIPGDRVLAEGDIVSIDCGAVVDGWHADAAITVGVGEIDDLSQRLIDAAWAGLDAAIALVRDGSTIGDLGAAVSGAVAPSGFAVVREYTGHGIGTQMHEPPEIPNHGRAGRGLRLRPGHVVAIEPMIVAGRATLRELADGWTVVTVDGSRAAHVEHTIAVTENGPEVLTLP